MRLYSQTDLERCARLAVLSPEENHESAVTSAVETIIQETPDVYTREQLERAANQAARLVLEGLDVPDAVQMAVARL